MRLIDADAVIIKIFDEFDYVERLEERGAILAERIRRLINTAPTVDAVPVVHGRWQWISSTYDRIPCEKRYWCIKCHHETITHDSEPWEKFCPNCGARMDGKDGDT